MLLGFLICKVNLCVSVVQGKEGVCQKVVVELHDSCGPLKVCDALLVRSTYVFYVVKFYI